MATMWSRCSARESALTICSPRLAISRQSVERGEREPEGITTSCAWSSSVHCSYLPLPRNELRPLIFASEKYPIRQSCGLRGQLLGREAEFPTDRRIHRGRSE